MSRYMQIHEIMNCIDRGPRERLKVILHENRQLFEQACGSKFNHQNWPGGYIDHVTEVMNIARMLYPVYNQKRQLPFTLSDALIVLFLHDLEKPFKERVHAYIVAGNAYKQAKALVRMDLINSYGLMSLCAGSIGNALTYAEGEGNNYSNQSRVMEPLAAFVHICDLTSARIWFDNPKDMNDTWGWRGRS